jgi:hypothetical protein
MRQDHVGDAGNRDEAVGARRRHLRSTFTYPVEFKLFSQKAEGMPFVGFLKDISLGGAGLEIEDQYGRFDIAVKNSRVILTLSIPRENKTNIVAFVQWVKRKEGTHHIEMGISFKDLDYKDLIVIEKLVGLRGKDHNMMWNLWERYYR